MMAKEQPRAALVAGYGSLSLPAGRHSAEQAWVRAEDFSVATRGKWEIGWQQIPPLDELDELVKILERADWAALPFHSPIWWARLGDQRLIIGRGDNSQPLFYARTDQAALVTTDLPNLLQHHILPRQLNKAAVRSFIAKGKWPNHRLPWRGINLLPAGWLVEITKEERRARPYGTGQAQPLILKPARQAPSAEDWRAATRLNQLPLLLPDRLFHNAAARDPRFLYNQPALREIACSAPFASRSILNPTEVISQWQAAVRQPGQPWKPAWRALALEIWMELFYDPSAPKQKVASQEKKQGQALALPQRIDQEETPRWLFRTPRVERDTNLEALVGQVLQEGVGPLPLPERPYAVVISEKIVAISQGRSRFLWDILPSRLALFLSRHVRRTPHGIGLGSPWTMQLALEEVGAARILLAAAASSLTKPFGLTGIFYRVAGRSAAAIDGPTSYSLYPSNISAKLSPAAPSAVARRLQKALHRRLTGAWRSQLAGVVIIDANDLGQEILGNSTNWPDAAIAKLFRDNPMGQTDEQTPLAIVLQPESIY